MLCVLKVLQNCLFETAVNSWQVVFVVVCMLNTVSSNMQGCNDISIHFSRQQTSWAAEQFSAYCTAARCAVSFSRMQSCCTVYVKSAHACLCCFELLVAVTDCPRNVVLCGDNTCLCWALSALTVQWCLPYEAQLTTKTQIAGTPPR